MTNVSKKDLSVKVENRVMDVLGDFFVDIRNQEYAAQVIKDFFTPKERILFAKRLGIYILIYEGLELDQIAEQLSLAPQSIRRVQELIRYKGEPVFTRFIKSIIKLQIPSKTVDLDPIIFRGKRLHRKFSVQKPNRYLPY